MNDWVARLLSCDDRSMHLVYRGIRIISARKFHSFLPWDAREVAERDDLIKERLFRAMSLGWLAGWRHGRRVT